jgi:hypothetical protein
MKPIRLTKVSLTPEAARQLEQLRLSRRDLSVVLGFGRKHRRASVTRYVLGQRQIPAGCERKLERLVGTTVRVANGQIITVDRNRRAISKTKKKAKRRGKSMRVWGYGRMGDCSSREQRAKSEEPDSGPKPTALRSPLTSPTHPHVFSGGRYL